MGRGLVMSRGRSVEMGYSGRAFRCWTPLGLRRGPAPDTAVAPAFSVFQRLFSSTLWTL